MNRGAQEQGLAPCHLCDWAEGDADALTAHYLTDHQTED